MLQKELYRAGQLGLLLLLSVATEATPLKWSRSRARDPVPTSSTLIPWEGTARISGAFLLSRINLDFINETCTKFASMLETATEVAQVLEKTQLVGTSSNQQKRYGYTFLRMDSEFRDTLYYLHDLVLCSGRGSELWSNFIKFRNQTSPVWKLLRVLGVSPIHTRTHSQGLSELMSLQNPTVNHTGNQLINLLYQARSNITLAPRQPRALFILGAGLGLIGGAIVTKIFGGDSTEEIRKLNNNLSKNNKLIKLTNERVDILTKNISRSNEIIKSILDKMAENSKNSDIHYAIQWNLDQLVAVNLEIQNTFRLGELTLTLLDSGILNPDLINLNSLKAIIREGLELFPHLSFPVDISRFHLHYIVKILKVQRVGRMQFVMIIPLTGTQNYEVFTIIPHPIKISEHDLAIPKIKHTILKDKDDTYIITNRDRVQSISSSRHILLEVEPIFRQNFVTCEWAVFNGDTREILKKCNFEKAGRVNDTFVIDTDKSRLVYFTRETEVELDCPGKQLSTKLLGLHNISLACDITTHFIHWPARQTATIEITLNTTETFNTLELPIAFINKDSEIHTSLKELINKLPKKNQSYTFDFEYYDLSLEEVQTYTILSQSCITILVIINSVLIGFMLYQRSYNRNSEPAPRGRTSFLGESFRRIRDNIVGSFRTPKKPPNKSEGLSHPQGKPEFEVNLSNRSETPDDGEPPRYRPQVYPPLPRYKY